MDRHIVIEKIKNAVYDVLGESIATNDLNITEETRLFQTGLEFSSIDGVMLAVKLEEIFDILWPDDLLAFDDILSIGQVADVVISCMENREGST